MHFRRGRATDQQRDVEFLALQFASNVTHLLQRGCDQARYANQVSLLCPRSLEDGFSRYHNAEVDDLVTVTLQNHGDDILANIMNVTTRGREHDLAAAAARSRGFHQRFEKCDGLFHHSCRLDDLWQKHLAAAEQITNDVHAVHEWSLDQLQRSLDGLKCFSGIGLDVIGNSLNQCMLEPFENGQFSPGFLFLDIALARIAISFCDLDKAFGRVRVTVQNDVLDRDA